MIVTGINIQESTPSGAAQRLIQAATEKEYGSYHFINAYTISLAANDLEYKKVLREASAVYPDGKPLQWILRVRGSTASQVRGPQAFEEVLSVGRSQGVRHFLLGGSPSTLQKLHQSIERKYPGVLIVGTYSPPFRTMSDPEVVAQDEMIRASGADIVWVGLGTPKQDREALRVARSVPVLTAAVGAAFDFTAGTKKTAPHWISNIGFEWLYRFATEPRRLWRRYTVGNYKFVQAVFKNWRSDIEHQKENIAQAGR